MGLKCGLGRRASRAVHGIGVTTYNRQPARQRGVEVDICGVVGEIGGGCMHAPGTGPGNGVYDPGGGQSFASLFSGPPDLLADIEPNGVACNKQTSISFTLRISRIPSISSISCGYRGYQGYPWYPLEIEDTNAC